MRWLRRLVSTNKRRWQEGPYDLDLSYILNGKLIAMCYPSTGLRSFIRNPMQEAAAFLRSRHGCHLRVYNLCIEPGWQYPPDALHPAQVVHLPMWDGQSPPLEVMHQFCQGAAAWLLQDPNHCVAVHCKAGKGRTGALIAALLIYLLKYAPSLVPDLASQANSLHKGTSSTCETHGSSLRAAAAMTGGDSCASHAAEEGPQRLQEAGQQLDLCQLVLPALNYYGQKRTTDGRGLTICSQRRYVSYYAHWLAQSSGSLQLASSPSLQHGAEQQALTVPVQLLWVAVAGLSTPQGVSNAESSCMGANSTTQPSRGMDVSTGGLHQAANLEHVRQWFVPPVTLTVWLRPPGQHTPHLVAYGFAGMQSGAVPQPASSQVPVQLQVDLLQDGRLQMCMPTHLHLSKLHEVADGNLQNGANQHSPTDSAATAAAEGPMDVATTAGIRVTGDIKVQVLPGWHQPDHPAVFKRGSLMYTWLHTAFLDEHMQHVAAACRPDSASVFGGRQVPVAAAGDPGTIELVPVHSTTVAVGEPGSVDSQLSNSSAQTKVLTLDVTELDKVDKGLRTRHGLSLQIAYQPTTNP